MAKIAPLTVQNAIRKTPLVLLVSAFLTLDFALLYINFSVTHQLKQDTRLINLAGRQRMLSQRIAKFSLISNQQQSPPMPQLRQAVEQFHHSLTAMQLGGKIETPGGNSLVIDPLTDPVSQQYLQHAMTLWLPVYQQLQDWQADTPLESGSVTHNFAVSSNEKLLILMNALTVRIEQLSGEKIAILRYAQAVIFALVLINFLLVILRLRHTHKINIEFMHQLKNFVQDLPQAIFFVDQRDRILYANRVAEHTFQFRFSSAEKLSISQLLPLPLKPGHITLRGKHLEVDISRAISASREMRIISLLDVTESILLKQKSCYDPLTQLLNRTGLTEAFNDMQGNNQEVCCLFLDLDGFKHINDSYGHSVGDDVLRVVAKRLKSCLKSEDIIARFGGDEFVVLLKGKLAATDIAQLCLRIKRIIRTDIDIEHLVIQLGISIGSRIGHPAEESLEVIIDDADRAMYVDKKQGKRE